MSSAEEGLWEADKEIQELVGEYEAAAWVLGNMAAHCGFPTDRDRGIAGMMLPLGERCLWYAEFQKLWSEYQQALSVPFSLDREEDARIKAEVERCYDQLARLAKEGM